MKKFLCSILLVWSVFAQAATVLLEDWNDFSDWTLGTLSNPVRFTSQNSVTSFGHVFTPTEMDKLLRITSGYSGSEPSLIYKKFGFNSGDILAFDWFTVYRSYLYDINGNMIDNDATYFLLSTDAVNFSAYQLTDGLTLGGVAGDFTGWNTSYVNVLGSGDLYLGFAAIDAGGGASLFFGTDNLRLVDEIPTTPPSPGGTITRITTYDFGGPSQEPRSTVPEPGSLPLVLSAGLLGLGMTAQRKRLVKIGEQF